jgi:hypothetical protein
LLLCIVNYQKELPNVPIQNINTIIRIPENLTPTSCRTVSNNKPVKFHLENGNISIELPLLETIEMIEIN